MIELRGTIRNLAKWFRLCERLVDRSPRMERNTDNSARVAGGPTSTGVLTRGQMARALREGALGEVRSGGTGGGVTAGAISRVDVRKYINNNYLRTSCGGVTLAMLMAAAITVAPTAGIPRNSANVPSSGLQRAGSIPRTPSPFVGDGNSVHPYVSDVNQGHQKKMLNKITSVTAAAVVGIATTVAGAADLLVPAQYPTIQAAIDAAAVRDTVLVSTGIYSPFSLNGKTITVRGDGPAGGVVVDAAGKGRAVDASNILIGEAVLENLVIRNASLASGDPVGGAGIEAENSNLALLSVRVENCSVMWSGYGMFRTQGAGLRASNSSVRIVHCTFSGNTTTVHNLGDSYSQGLAYGSAIAVYGGSLTITDSDIVGNSAIATTQGTSWHDVQARGAGIYTDATNLVIEYSRISENSCSATQLTSGVASCQAFGAGVCVLAGTGTSTIIRHCEFVNNQLMSQSSTTYSPEYNATRGAAIYFYGSGSIEDCTVVGNAAVGGLLQPAISEGGGIYIDQGSVAMSRCVISQNNSGVAASSGIRRGGAIAVNGGVVTLENSNICENTSDQVSLQAGAVVVDSGGNCIQELCESCAPLCIADLTVNGVVDGADLGALLAFWGPRNPVFPQADINGDGVVNGADLGLLLANWGPCGQ